MTLVRAEYVFGVRSAWIAPGLAGASAKFSLRDRLVQLDLPVEGGGFGPLLPGTSAFTRPVMAGGGSPVGISEVRVGVFAEARDLPPPSELPIGELRNARLPELWGLWHDNLPVAQAVCAAFLDWVRVRCGQYWLGLHGQFRLPIGGARCTVRHAASNEDYQLWIYAGYPSEPTMPGERPLTSEDVGEMARLFSTGDSGVKDPDLLAADAMTHLCGPWPDLRRAVLMAAIACESGIKSALLESTPPDRLELLKLIIDNPRDVTLAAANLYHKVSLAAVGRSLHDDNPEIYGRIERLFRARNRFAHRAEVPEPGVEDLVAAALDALAWVATWDRCG